MNRKQVGKLAEEEKAEYGYVEIDPTGRYGRFDQVLGKGAMKVVYKAIDEVLGMEVAWNQVKLCILLRTPEELRRVYSEVHLLSTLDHDSIIRFYTSWIDVDRKTFNFITEMFTSGTLREYRKKYKGVDNLAIKSWARQILRGLVYLHGHDPPVIHRDIKCDNIFVNGHLGQVKIGDLGLAAILRGSRAAHSIIGTPEFMAPELYEEDYNELVDVYSFGMCVLEMLTSEYPYSECNNPAQIYKKVTSRKLPGAFYQIQDLEARRFIGKCLESASKRLSAKELLLDPFLKVDEAESVSMKKIARQKPFLNNIGMGKLRINNYPPRTNMEITGKLNPEGDTIFLRVQTADKNGVARNIYFPFDIIIDTPLAVATEMVKELEITDWEPIEISDMIDGEISAIVPTWKKRAGLPQPDEPYQTYDYQEEDDGPQNGSHSPSSCSSPQTSFSGLITSGRMEEMTHDRDWLQDDLFEDASPQCSSHSDTSSQSSSHSTGYSNLNYFSGDEHDLDISSKRRDQQSFNTTSHKSTRFCPQEKMMVEQYLDRNVHKQCKDKLVMDNRRLMRNRSLVDVRSQLLHRSLVEEVTKRRLSKTIGAVENIGFQAPCDISGKMSKPLSGAPSMRTSRDGKGKGPQKRRV